LGKKSIKIVKLNKINKEILIDMIKNRIHVLAGKFDEKNNILIIE
jgi:hypothetical protein